MAYEFLFLDYETRSLDDLSEVGTDNYAKSKSTEILMLGWALDREEIQLWQPHVERPPQKLVDAMYDTSILKIAWSSAFEYNITRQKFGAYIDKPKFSIPLAQWRDPIVLAHNISLPGKLEKVGPILKMEQQKFDKERADALKKMFCMPVSKGGEMTLFGIAPPLFRDWTSHPKEWAEFCAYCIQDVRAERDLWYRLIRVPFPERDWRGWLLDQKINDFGMPGNRDLGEKALRIAIKFHEHQKAELKKMTGLKNPNSDKQMMEWSRARGYTMNSMRANFVQAILDDANASITVECREALELRRDVKKSSYKKLERFLAVLSNDDDRLRNQFKYMAAARTGRWAGGDVQVQNLPRGEKAVKKNLGRALALLAAEDYETIKKEFYDSVADKKKKVSPVAFVITLLRSLFQAKPGKKLVVADLNAIENRVLGWASGCWSILEVFAMGRCPYMSFGAKMFKVPYEEWYVLDADGKHKPKNEHFEELRQQSKPAVLGAGYGLGGGDEYENEHHDIVRGGLWGYAKNVCGVDISRDFAHNSVKIFREEYTEVVKFWEDLEEGWKQCLRTGRRIRVGEVTWDDDLGEWIEHPTMRDREGNHFANGNHCVIEFQRMSMQGGGYMIRMVLPSGRALHYINATIDEEVKTSKRTGRKYTVEILRYDGIEHSASTDASGAQAKKSHKWGRVKTYGGKLCENAVQAISRDLLLNGMFLADDMGFCIFGLFHDELACEVDDTFDGLTVRDLIWCMSEVPDWAPGLLLGAEGFESQYYKKG